MAARNHFDPQAIAAAVTQAHARYGRAPGGANASDIPYLVSVPAALAGVAVDGQVFEAGDSRYAFAIESISELCSLALALKQHGSDEIEKKTSADATGLSFNSVTTLELHGNRPLGPLGNAGALTMISVIEATDGQDRGARIRAMQCRLAGRPSERSDEVDQSQQSTNDHIALDRLKPRPPVAGTMIKAEMTMAGLYHSSGDWASTSVSDSEYPAAHDTAAAVSCRCWVRCAPRSSAGATIKAAV